MKALVIRPPHDLAVEEVPSDPLGPAQLRVHIRAGGICGSDLHYYQHGGFGTVRVKEPMVLGHEVSGTVVEVGGAVTGFHTGDRIAISPSRPCGQCRYCLAGMPNQCLAMRFYGSAAPTPHVNGAFRQEIVVEAWQAHKVGDRISDAEAAMAEPLSVALHAVRRAGQILGNRVLVTGSGPIGVLIVMAARRAGAAEIVATDIADEALAVAGQAGADRVINTGSDPAALAAFGADKGSFDVMFEASGSQKALAGGIDAVRPRGVIMQVGNSGAEMTLPVNVVTAKELDLRGSYRFHEEFAQALTFLNSRLIDVRPLITASYPFTEFREAFALAGDRSRAMKVQLTFS
ncbi:MAG: L-idonate 5-dehydrogenase [Telmatospirillum sp.]|nr:L-idonate 5-dehydrogenase [Telmatospirillum sp.]